MSTKTKIMAFVSLASLTMVLLMVGVWALKTVDFTVGGNLSYIAPGVEATISKGTMSNGIWVNASDASTKMPLTQITRTDTEESLEEKFSYWQNLNLNFNETGDDVTITFSITNDMEKYGLAINVTTSCDDADNATISINTSSVTLAPDASQEFVITLAVTEKTANASLLGFSVVFNMEMTDIPPTPAEDVSYLTFEYDDTTMEAKLVGYDGVTEDVVIPSNLLYNQKSYQVTSMTETEEVFMSDGYSQMVGVFVCNENLKSISWPSSMPIIEEYTFEECVSLERVVIEKGVTNIGECAFDYCTSLTSITIPNGVTSIGFFAFGGCTKLTTITIPASVTSIGTNPFDSCSGLETIIVESGNTVYNSNNNCNAIIETSTNTLITGCKNTVIPSTVTSIGGYAFCGCTGLTSITIPDGVTSIDIAAFSGCTSLETVEVKATIPPTLSAEIFYNCPLTTGIFVPSASVDAYKQQHIGKIITSLMEGFDYNKKANFMVCFFAFSVFGSAKRFVF